MNRDEVLREIDECKRMIENDDHHLARLAKWPNARITVTIRWPESQAGVNHKPSVRMEIGSEEEPLGEYANNIALAVQGVLDSIRDARIEAHKKRTEAMRQLLRSHGKALAEVA